MRVGYLGPAGTFSEEAVRSAPDADGAELVALRDRARRRSGACRTARVERAVVPIENSLEGSVGATLDALAEEPDVAIVGEVVLAGAPCLIAREPIELDAIERVVSHPQALAQCARFLRGDLPGADVVSRGVDRRGGARSSPPTAAPWAAIGTRRAAELYGATVLPTASRTSPATRRASSGSRAAAPRPTPRGRRRPRSSSGAPATTARAGSCAACRSSRSAA